MPLQKPATRPLSRLAPVKDATKGSAGRATSSLVLHEHADAPRERRGVLEVVGDEQGGNAELGEELLQLAPHGRLRARVECRERLVEEQHLRLSRERAGQGDPLALSAGEFGRPRVRQSVEPEAPQVGVRPLPARELDVLPYRQVREERVVLKEEPDRALVDRAVHPARRVEPGFPGDRDRARARPD